MKLKMYQLDLYVCCQSNGTEFIQNEEVLKIYLNVLDIFLSIEKKIKFQRRIYESFLNFSVPGPLPSSWDAYQTFRKLLSFPKGPLPPETLADLHRISESFDALQDDLKTFSQHAVLQRCPLKLKKKVSEILQKYLCFWENS